MPAKTFGSQLRAHRRAARMSQRELARRVNLDFSYISKLENGHLPPPAADTIVNMCRALNIAPEGLLAFVGKIPSDVHEAISTSTTAQLFIREAQRMKLTEEEWESLLRTLQTLRG